MIDNRSRLGWAAPAARRRTSLTRLCAVCLFWLCQSLTPTALASPADDLPTLGDGSSRIVSPAMEKQIGRQFLKQINAVLPTIDDPILKYYVERHIADLAQYSELKEKVLEVVLIDSPAVNAFAAPGGVVGVNLGLMLTAEDVHEYSSVMAHELAHLSQRHFARGIEEQREAMLPTMASMIAAIAIGMAAGGDAGVAAMSASQAAAQSSQLRYMPQPRDRGRPDRHEHTGERRHGSGRHGPDVRSHGPSLPVFEPAAGVSAHPPPHGTPGSGCENQCPEVPGPGVRRLTRLHTGPDAGHRALRGTVRR